MNANIVIPENLVVLHIKPNLPIYDFHDFFNDSSIVTASFKKITVF